MRAEGDLSVECLTWLCPQTVVGQLLRDFFVKSMMMMIQGDGQIAGRSDHIRGGISLATPNTLHIVLKDEKVIPEGTHSVHLPGQKFLVK